MNYKYSPTKQIFSTMSVPVNITTPNNTYKENVIITNPKISKEEKRHIHSMKVIQRGSLIKYDEYDFLVISESITPRHAKYKAIAQHCNMNITIFTIEWEIALDEDGNPILDDQGRPEMVEVKKEYNVPAVGFNANFRIDEGQIRVPLERLYIDIQDNEKNKELFKMNATFEYGEEWKVVDQDITQRGLLKIICEKTT
ncbi:hypothetical protein CD798_08060 [Bacillaceae bacterium SAOS 7]|nr:hypothetical protein CD798_08060 [Bacillaceae bacterium SAOS 7]